MTSSSSKDTDATASSVLDYDYHVGGWGSEFDANGNPTPGATYRKAMKADLKTMILDKVVFDFYGAHSNYFCLGQNGNKLVFEVLEDPSDGYRSFYHSTIVAKNPGGFFDTPIAQVRMSMAKFKNDPYYILKDTQDKHVWLRFGTGNSHDYYPFFVFSYFPKKGSEPSAT